MSCFVEQNYTMSHEKRTDCMFTCNLIKYCLIFNLSPADLAVNL